MGEKKPNSLLFFAVAMTAAVIIQVYGTLRYARRLSGDTVGIVLYSVTGILFAVLAAVNHVRRARDKWLSGEGNRP